MVESTASGGASNSLVNLNRNTELWLNPYNWPYDWLPSGNFDEMYIFYLTVFSGENCSGDSSEIELDTMYEGITTWGTYRWVEKKLTVGSNIQSVYIPA